MVTKMEENQQQLLSVSSKTNNRWEVRWTKATRRMIAEELTNMKTTLEFEVRFLIEQLQVEIQKEILDISYSSFWIST